MATKHSNWRDDLREVVDSDSEDQNDNEIKEKKVKNKIDINPSIKESIESIGGQLIDIRKISEGKYEDCDCKGCGDDGVGHQNPCVECGGHHKEENEVYEASGRWVDSKGRSHTFSFDTNIVDHEYIKDLVKSRYPAKRIFIKTDKEKSKKKKDEKKVKKESKDKEENDYLDGKFEVDRQDAMGNYISPEKRDKKKGIKKVKKESFSNWREENLTENGNKNKPGYVNIGMGVWVKKEDAEKKKAQLAKSVRGENIPGFKGGRLD